MTKIASGSGALLPSAILVWQTCYGSAMIRYLAALTALRQGSPVITDIRMVQVGIQKKGHRSDISAHWISEQRLHGNEVLRGALRVSSPQGKTCRIDRCDRQCAIRSPVPVHHDTRGDLPGGSHWGAGGVCQCRRIKRTSPHNKSTFNITEGTRGGTPVAVAAMNECITIFIEGKKE